MKIAERRADSQRARGHANFVFDAVDVLNSFTARAHPGKNSLATARHVLRGRLAQNRGINAGSSFCGPRTAPQVLKSVLRIVARAGSGAVLDEKRHDGLVLESSCDVERRAAIRVGGVDIDAKLP